MVLVLFHGLNWLVLFSILLAKESLSVYFEQTTGSKSLEEFLTHELHSFGLFN